MRRARAFLGFDLTRPICVYAMLRSSPQPFSPAFLDLEHEAPPENRLNALSVKGGLPRAPEEHPRRRGFIREAATSSMENRLVSDFQSRWVARQLCVTLRDTGGITAARAK